VIKTGGQWISAIDLENAAIAHPAVAMAAVIGVKHPKRDERPLIFLESLPVGGTGKVQKGDLRKTYGGVFS
jgi:fatty-acyl-CoA synthase